MSVLNIKYININKLKPYKKNAKKHNKTQIEQIANSIKQFGFTQPVIIDENNVVVAGHGRILGAKQAGLKQVPTVMLSDLTEEQIKAYRLVDNKTNESDWDYQLLDAELDELFGELNFDMSVFGFDEQMSDEELEEEMVKEISFKVKKKHLVIIECKTEEETKSVKKEIERLGYKCDIKNA